MVTQVDCRTSSKHSILEFASAYPAPNLAPLRKLVGSHGSKPVYGYVIRTVAMKDGIFHQHGCGPNWEGGLITLCTCKGYMRTYHDAAEWPGHWIAGFSGSTATLGCNALVYLMRVGQAHASFADLWKALPAETRTAKSASTSRHGDLYEPVMSRMVDIASRFQPANYEPPLPTHSHAKPDSKNPSVPSWHGDINKLYKGKRPALLVGDPGMSVVWKLPLIELGEVRLGRGCKKWNSVHEFLSDLVDFAEALYPR